jgi:hypothetical protein
MATNSRGPSGGNTLRGVDLLVPLFSCRVAQLGQLRTNAVQSRDREGQYHFLETNRSVGIRNKNHGRSPRSFGRLDEVEVLHALQLGIDRFTSGGSYVVRLCSHWGFSGRNMVLNSVYVSEMPIPYGGVWAESLEELFHLDGR